MLWHMRNAEHQAGGCGRLLLSSFIYFVSEKSSGVSGYEEFLTHLLQNKWQICLLNCTTWCYWVPVALFGATLMQHLQHSREQTGTPVKWLYFSADSHPNWWVFWSPTSLTFLIYCSRQLSYFYYILLQLSLTCVMSVTPLHSRDFN